MVALLNWLAASGRDMIRSASVVLPRLAIGKGAGSIYPFFVGFLVVSSFLRFVFRRRRRGRYVANVVLRLAVLDALVLRACLLVGFARACLWWVGFFVCLVPLGVALLALSCLLFVSPSSLSLPLSATASGKPSTLQATIWGGHLMLAESGGGNMGYML